jgi:hypothetical protein
VPGFLLPENKTNMSYIDVHDVLVHGFELSWVSACCHSVKENRCNLDEFTRIEYCRHGTYFFSLSLSASLKYCIVIIDTVFALFSIDKNLQEIFYKSILMISIVMIEK